MSNPYLFIDRDGTIIEEPITDKQVDSLEKLAFLPGVIPALLQLQAAGYRLVMVSNQDGLGTDSFPTADFDIAQDKMMDILNSQGINFEDVLICPHFDEQNCDCRKPKTGMLENAKLDFPKIDVANSFLVGDSDSDIAAGNSFGLRTIKVTSDFTLNDWLETLS